jgi:predicted metal-dependent phosphoesterase TrpH
MPVPGALAALALLVGVTVGTLVDTVPGRVVPRSGDNWILAGDFHVHAFPGDGTLAAGELRREAWRAGLDVIAVTNHNQTLAAHLVARSGRSGEPLVMVGQEITNPGYHLIAVGITVTVDADQPAAEAIRAVHAQGGVAIAAHPSRKYWSAFDDDALALLDGTEAAHAAMRGDGEFAADLRDFFERARQQNSTIAAIGSSDFHSSPALGLARTYIVARERSEGAVLDAIREGRTVAVDGDGGLHGDPDLVRLVAANRPAGRAGALALWRRVSIVCAWAGLLGLILFNRRSTRSSGR